MININKYLIFFRIKDWVHVLGLVVLGFVCGSGWKIEFGIFILSLLIGSLHLAYGYSLNNCFDINVNYRFLKDKDIFSFKRAMLLSHYILVINCLICLFFFKRGLALVISGAVLAWIYSAPPTRLKNVPVLGLFCNSMAFGVLFLMGYCINDKLDIRSIVWTFFILILFLPVQLIHELNDIKDDRLKKINTTVSKYGVKGTLDLISFFLLILIGWALLLNYLSVTSIYLFFLTIIFSISMSCFLFKRTSKGGTYIETFKLKLQARYLVILFGIGMFFILCET